MTNIFSQITENIFDTDNAFFDRILLDYFWKKRNTYCITVSPKILSHDQEIYWQYANEHILNSFQYFGVYERAENRLHFHGVIKLKNADDEASFHMQNQVIGFCKFSKFPKKQWYNYLFKEPVSFIYNVGPHNRSSFSTEGWFSDPESVVHPDPTLEGSDTTI